MSGMGFFLRLGVVCDDIFVVKGPMREHGRAHSKLNSLAF